MLTTNLVPAVETAPTERSKEELKMEEDIKDERDLGSETDSELDKTMDFLL